MPESYLGGNPMPISLIVGPGELCETRVNIRSLGSVLQGTVLQNQHFQMLGKGLELGRQVIIRFSRSKDTEYSYWSQQKHPK